MMPMSSGLNPGRHSIGHGEGEAAPQVRPARQGGTLLEQCMDVVVHQVGLALVGLGPLAEHHGLPLAFGFVLGVGALLVLTAVGRILGRHHLLVESASGRVDDDQRRLNQARSDVSPHQAKLIVRRGPPMVVRYLGLSCIALHMRQVAKEVAGYRGVRL